MRPPPEKNRINLDFSNKIRYFLSKQASKQASKSRAAPEIP